MDNYISFKEAQEIRRKTKNVNQSECDHLPVREEINGMHSDYVCISCGFSSTNINHFRKSK